MKLTRIRWMSRDAQADLECGDLSPLSPLATRRQRAARQVAPRKGGDKSRHSKAVPAVLIKAETREWVRFAEADFDTASYLWRKRQRLLTRAICFHCQQCVEKYFKARLIEAGLHSPKTNDLVRLVNLLVSIEPVLATFQPVLGSLTAAYSIQFRQAADLGLKQDAKAALENCRAIRKEVRASLGLPKK